MFEVIPNVHGLLYLKGMLLDEGVTVILAAHTTTFLGTDSFGLETFTIIVSTIIFFAFTSSLRFLIL